MRVEVFVKDGDEESNELIKIIRELESTLEGKIEVKVYGEEAEFLNQYHVKYLPCVIIEGMIKIQGICPSRETILKALREFGLQE